MPDKEQTIQVDPNNANSDEYRQTLSEIASSGGCPAPFCKITGAHHKNGTIMEGRFWRVTRNSYNYQGAQHAFLIIYKEHVESLTQTIRPESDIELMNIVRGLVKEYDAPGATLAMMIRFGDTDRTGASVNHLHAHLIIGHPRQEGAARITACVGFEKQPESKEE